MMRICNWETSNTDLWIIELYPKLYPNIHASAWMRVVDLLHLKWNSCVRHDALKYIYFYLVDSKFLKENYYARF